MPQLPVHTVDTAPPPAFQPAFEACGCFLELACCCFPPPFGPPPSCSGGAVGLGSEDQAGHLKILLLLRQPHKSEPNVWGVPGGKLHLDVGEMAEQAMARELQEETGLSLDALSEPGLRECGRVYVRYPEQGMDFVYHMFKARLKPFQGQQQRQPPLISIDPREHKSYRWATLEEALELPLVRGEVECIALAYPEK